MTKKKRKRFLRRISVHGRRARRCPQQQTDPETGLSKEEGIVAHALWPDRFPPVDSLKTGPFAEAIDRLDFEDFD